jgi:alpha,alpha-trehalase
MRADLKMSRRVRRRGSVAALLLALFPIASTQPRTAPAAAYPEPPQVLFKDLFVAVQSAVIYQDGKAFPDATPNAAPADILAQYHASHPESPQALKGFTDAHFTLPGEATSAASLPEQVSIVRHIDQLWGALTRSTSTAPRYSSLLPLPRPYVIAGGRFREIYYWDSYFTMLGLQQSGRHNLVADMVRDFAYLIDTYGHVPNRTRSYYLSRSLVKLGHRTIAPHQQSPPNQGADSAQDHAQLVDLRFMTIGVRHGVSLHLCAAHPQQ